MKTWKNPELKELEFTSTEARDMVAGRGKGNNDTNIHKGWCEMHKHPENGLCTCGAVVTNPS